MDGDGVGELMDSGSFRYTCGGGARSVYVDTLSVSVVMVDCSDPHSVLKYTGKATPHELASIPSGLLSLYAEAQQVMAKCMLQQHAAEGVADNMIGNSDSVVVNVAGHSSGDGSNVK